MNKIQLGLLTLLAAAPIALFAACGGDDNVATPINKPDAAPIATDSGVDSGVDASPNTCANGIAFDNKASISSWPNLPQP